MFGDVPMQEDTLCSHSMREIESSLCHPSGRRGFCNPFSTNPLYSLMLLGLFLIPVISLSLCHWGSRTCPACAGLSVPRQKEKSRKLQDVIRNCGPLERCFLLPIYHQFPFSFLAVSVFPFFKRIPQLLKSTVRLMGILWAVQLFLLICCFFA